MTGAFHWLDVERIAEELADAHEDVNPLDVNFVDLREMVENLIGFEPQDDHPVNERILETIQVLWLEEGAEVVEEED
jgi:FeS assembly protein IscX